MGSFQNTRARYFYINSGKLAYNAGDKTNPDWKTEENFMGYLTDISFKHVDANPEKKQAAYEALHIHLDDGQEKAVLICKFESGYGRAFAKIIGNADLSQQVGIQPTFKVDNGQKIGGMMIKQGETWLKWKWTNDNPGECPPAVKHVIGTKEIIDYSEQMLFLKNFLLNTIKPKLGAAPAAAHPLMAGTSDIQQAADKMAETNKGFQPVQTSEDPDGIADDLPF
jgi:hypothetical protein